MNCDQSQKAMIDVLYGEEVEPRSSFRFFSHLGSCKTCAAEYEELLTTREKLGEWEVEEPGSLSVDLRRPSFSGLLAGSSWWRTAQRLAAAFLILCGVLYLSQSLGLLGGGQMVVSEQQLAQMMRDMILAEQLEERERILEAVLRVKEDLEVTQKSNLEQMQEYLHSFERQYVSSLEENNHFLQTFLEK